MDMDQWLQVLVFAAAFSGAIAILQQGILRHRAKQDDKRLRDHAEATRRELIQYLEPLAKGEQKHSQRETHEQERTRDDFYHVVSATAEAPLTVEVLAEQLRRAGLSNLGVEKDAIFLGITDHKVRALVVMHVDDVGGVSVVSTSTSIPADALSHTLSKRLLILNGENKMGAIGVVEDGARFRIDVDQYLNLAGQVPSIEALRLLFGALMTVHHEVHDALQELGVEEPSPA